MASKDSRGLPACGFSLDEVRDFFDGILGNERADEFDRHRDQCEVCRGLHAIHKTTTTQLPASPLANDSSSIPGSDPSTMPLMSRFEIIKILADGSGGSKALVYLVRDKQLDREVVLKVFEIKTTDDITEAEAKAKAEAEAKAKAEDEARKMATLDPSEGIIPIYESLVTDSHIIIVMPYLANGTLTSRLNEPMPTPEILRILPRICDAAQHILDSGISHRDIKPDNILFDRKNVPFLIDFSISLRHSDRSHDDFVHIGTVPWMAPEQLNEPSSKINASTDVWAIGVILYQMLTGRLPFDGDDIPTICQKILHGKPIDISKESDLGSICMKCLQPKGKDRYGSPEKLATELRKLELSKVPDKDNKVFDELQKIRVVLEERPEPSPISGRSLKIRPKSFVLAAILAILGISASAGMFFMNNSRDTVGPPGPSPIQREVVDRLPKIVNPGKWMVLELKPSNSVQNDLDSCLIEAGGRLTIEGSGVLKFNEGQGIIARGLLEVLGKDQDNLITFTRAVESKAWNGIALVGPGKDDPALPKVSDASGQMDHKTKPRTANDSVFRFAKIEGARGYLSSYEVDPRLSTSPNGYVAPAITIVEENDIRKHDYMLRRGAIMVNSCDNIQFNHVIFQKNETNLGGALFVYSSRKIHFINCLFEENHSIFEENHSKGKGFKLSPGGALYCQNSSDVSFKKCEFRRNQALGNTFSSGGAIYAGLNCDIEIQEDTKFIENFARYVGGAIYCAQSEILYKLKSDDKNGQIVSMPSPPRLRVSGCSFLNNSTAFWLWDQSQEYAAGNDIYIDDGYRLNVYETLFENLQSPGASIVAKSGKAAWKNDVTISHVTLQTAEGPSMIFPNFSEADALNVRGNHTQKHKEDIINIDMKTINDLTPKTKIPLKIQSLPIDPNCFKKSENDRKADTVVIHHASAIHWDTTDDPSFNSEARQKALERYPELATMTAEQRTFSPLAFKAILEAYKISSHFIIDREGVVYQLVPVRDVAWHAGESKMPEKFDPEKRSGVNRFSVGIELIATHPNDDTRVRADLIPGFDSPDLKGPNPAYTVAQYRSLRNLIKDINTTNDIQLKYVVGHDEIAPNRKQDPGPWFDWNVVRTKETGKIFTSHTK